jgi:hypothetical protein
MDICVRCAPPKVCNLFSEAILQLLLSRDCCWQHKHESLDEFIKSWCLIMIFLDRLDTYVMSQGKRL